MQRDMPTYRETLAHITAHMYKLDGATTTHNNV